MKRNNYTEKMSALRPFMLTLFMMCFTAMTWAQGEAGSSADNPLILKAGESNVVPESLKYKDLYATFTAEADGVLTLKYNKQTSLELYTDNTYTTLAEKQPELVNDFSPRIEELAVKTGETYYFMTSFCMNIGTIDVEFSTGEKKLELIKSNPEEGGKVLVGNTIDLEFNKPVICSKALLTTGTHAADVTGTVRTSSSHMYVDPTADIMQFFRNGSIKENDEITLTIEGLAEQNNPEKLYGEEGKLTIKFVAGAKPVELVAADNVPGSTTSNMETFMSYFMKNDNNAIATFEFDGNLNFEGDDAPKAVLIYGERTETGEGEYVEIPLTVEKAADNKLSIDFSGTLRRPQDMVPNATVYKTITLKVSNLKSTDGQFVYTTTQGSNGTLNYTYNYKVVEYEMLNEFEPGQNTCIDNVKTISIIVSQTNNYRMVYSGARFDYTYEGQAASVNAEATETPDESDPDISIIEIPVPEFKTDANTTVTVTLTDLEFPDGIDRSADLTATYTTEGNTTGIGSIAADSKADSAIYNVEGMKVAESNSAAAVKALKKGLYIINGKKVIVK